MKGKLMIFWILAIWIVTCVIPVFKMFSNIRGTSGIQAIYSFWCHRYHILSSVIYWSTYYKLKKQSMLKQLNIALQNSIESRAEEIRILK